MKLLILEGMATSGKSTIVDKLGQIIGSQNIKIYGEPDTHIPIMDKQTELHTDFFASLISMATGTSAELVVFDRLYLTQAFRAKATLREYDSIENTLLQYQALTIFLKVDEDAIAERVRLAAQHREATWGDYVKTKGKNFEEIADYYIHQQRSQLELLSHSKLKTKVFNTTDHDYDHIVQELLTILGIK